MEIETEIKAEVKRVEWYDRERDTEVIETVER